MLVIVTICGVSDLLHTDFLGGGGTFGSINIYGSGTVFAISPKLLNQVLKSFFNFCSY